MDFVLGEGKHLNDECSALVLPALSIGNVGQLTVDLLISSTRAERIGYLDDPYILPCVGNDAYVPIPKGELALSLEVYDYSSVCTIIQQRSPVIKGRMIEFAKRMADFAVSCRKKHVVVLSSLDFRRWQNFDMSSGLQVYYLSSTNVDGTDDDCERFGWKKLQEYNPAQRRWEYLSHVAEGKNVEEEEALSFEDEEADEDYYPSLPFAALFSCFKAKGFRVTCLLSYCSEGDNIPDASHLAEAACKLLKLSPKDFHEEGKGQCRKNSIRTKQ